MPAAIALEHYNVYCRDLAKTVDFYVTYVGLRDGARPPFPFPGAWLYAGDQAVLHLISESGRTAQGSGAIDHVALRCSGIGETIARLKRDAVPYTLYKVPTRPLQLIFIRDPDGIQIELNFWNEAPVDEV